MSLYVHQPKKKTGLWPMVAVGAAMFFVGGGAAVAIGLWQTSDQRSTLAALTDQLRSPAPAAAVPVVPAAPAPAVTRAADVRTMVLPPAGETIIEPAPTMAAAPPPSDLAALLAELSGETAVGTDAVAPINALAEAAIDPAVWQAQIGDAIQAAHHTKVQEISDAVVAGLYTVSASATPDSRIGFTLTTEDNPGAVTELEALLTQAVASGDIDVPPAIATAGGGFDAQALLFDLVQTNLQAGGAAEVAAAEELRRQGQQAAGIETEAVEGGQLYTVESGDNLAYIALIFYGSVADYPRIFEANRDVLSDPDRIQIGQQLRIPGA